MCEVAGGDGCGAAADAGTLNGGGAGSGGSLGGFSSNSRASEPMLTSCWRFNCMNANVNAREAKSKWCSFPFHPKYMTAKSRAAQLGVTVARDRVLCSSQ
jgi:hypothetical protein